MKLRLESWGPGDLALLTGLLGDPAMMVHLGGPESPQQIADRQARYENTPHSYKIVDAGEGVGWVGFWETGEDAFEVGWSVLPAAQRRGYATAAMGLLLDVIRAEGSDRRYVYAYPAVANGPSNAICRKLGFTLLGPEQIEYPKGHFMRCNVWRLDLRA